MQKYQEIISWVLSSVADGDWRSGYRLPAETELCRKFGVSRQTVRHALSELERHQVLYRVQGSGTFIRNGQPEKSFRTEDTRHFRVAVLSTYMDSYIFPSILGGIEECLSGEGFSTQISVTHNRVQKERACLEKLLRDANIDGLIAEPSRSALPNPNLHLYRALQEKNIPVLFFNAAYQELNCPCVRMDDQKAAADAVRILKEKGHTRIGAVLKSDDRQGLLRYQGYMDALLGAGLELSEDAVIWYATEDLPYLNHIWDCLQDRLKDCTAILCYNDLAAVRFADVLSENGLRIPEDISLVSIDNSEYAKIGKTPLTSMNHPQKALGEKAAEWMLRLIRGQETEPEYLFEAAAVHRDSVRNFQLL